MDASEFIGIALRDLHGALKAEIEPLTEAQLAEIPAPDANTIAFLLWHLTRTEDQVLIGQAGGQTPVWTAGGWSERIGDFPGQGTGFTKEQMLAVQPSKADLMGYCEAVWAQAAEVVKGLTPADLDRAPNPDRSSMTVGRSIANFVVGHGFWHLGDIRFAKGLMGMPFMR